MPRARPSHSFLALMILSLVGSLACANRGMQAPSIDSVEGTGSDDGGTASTDGPGGSGGVITAAGGATGAGGNGGANGGGGAGLASAGGAGGGNAGGGAGRTNAGGAGGANAGGIGGRTNAGGANGGGHGGQTNAGGAGGVNGGGNGGANSGGGAAGQTLPPLFAYYSFDQTAGPTIPDGSGNGHDGTLAGTATFPAGVIGNGFSLPGVTGDYVALPSALLQTVTSVTIALWVNVHADQTWQRVFDFGSSTNVYMFLTPHVGGNSIARFAITTSGGAAEQHLDATSVLPLGTWTHVAIVLGAAGGTLYINGAVVGSNAALTLRPADLGATTNDWLGRSQFGDPAFNGEIDELRIYTSALTADQIATIYTAR